MANESVPITGINWADHFGAEYFIPIRAHVALSKKVLVAGHTRPDGKWVAYISDVPGADHDDEVDLVETWGNRLPEPIARVLLPLFNGVPYLDR